jgi:hypothetical protein
MMAPNAIQMIQLVVSELGVIEKFGVTLTWAWAVAGANIPARQNAGSNHRTSLLDHRERTAARFYQRGVAG